MCPLYLGQKTWEWNTFMIFKIATVTHNPCFIPCGFLKTVKVCFLLPLEFCWHRRVTKKNEFLNVHKICVFKIQFWMTIWRVFKSNWKCIQCSFVVVDEVWENQTFWWIINVNFVKLMSSEKIFTNNDIYVFKKLFV